MYRQHRRFVALALIALLGPALVSTALAVSYCQASNLMLGQLSGSANIPYGQTTYTYSGGCNATFQCVNQGDDSSLCKLCISNELTYTSGPFTYHPGSPNPVYSDCTPGSVCGQAGNYGTNIQVTWNNIPRDGNTYRVTVGIAPYPTGGGDCSTQSYTLTSFNEFVAN